MKPEKGALSPAASRSTGRPGAESMEKASQLCLRKSPPPGARNSRTRHKAPPGSERFWRPWLPTQKEAERQRERNLRALGNSSEIIEDSVKLTQYTHPVRLFWPKSRCFDYLYHEAEALLRNFPVQATISFYENSESEEENDGLEHDSGAEEDY